MIEETPITRISHGKPTVSASSPPTIGAEKPKSDQSLASKLAELTN